MEFEQMKIPVTCPACSLFDTSAHLTLALRNDDIYDFTCSKGHRTIALLQAARFQVLFSIGLTAIVDGYPREAISTFAASLERFYELAVKVILLDGQANLDASERAWNLVKNQSERQLGAFIFLYTCNFGSPPPLLINTELRNAVIHKGKIPSIEEAIMFGDDVRMAIEIPLTTLKQRHSAAIKKYMLDGFSKSKSKSKEGHIKNIPFAAAHNLIKEELSKPVQWWLNDIRNWPTK